MVANQFCKTGWLSVDLERAAINQARPWRAPGLR